MASNFDNLNFNITATDNASAVLNQVLVTLQRIKSLSGSIRSGGGGGGRGSGSGLTRGFEVFSKTGQLIPKDYKRSVQQGNLNVYKSAKKNVAAQTELNAAYYIQERRTFLLNQQKKKNIDNQLKEELGIKKTNKAVKDNNKHLAKTAISLATVVRLARSFGHFLYGAISETGSYVENLNLFAVTFGKTYEQTAKWALNIADNFGLASNEVIKFTGLFKQLSTAIGVTGEVGTELSKTLTQLGYDFASFYNISTTSAMEKLQAGVFSGQTKPLTIRGTRKRFLVKKLRELVNTRCERYKIAC